MGSKARKEKKQQRSGEKMAARSSSSSTFHREVIHHPTGVSVLSREEDPSLSLSLFWGDVDEKKVIT